MGFEQVLQTCSPFVRYPLAVRYRSVRHGVLMLQTLLICFFNASVDAAGNANGSFPRNGLLRSAFTLPGQTPLDTGVLLAGEGLQPMCAREADCLRFFFPWVFATIILGRDFPARLAIRYFDIWRTRVRMMETSMYAPLLRLKGVRVEDGWNEALALDYEQLHFHISFLEAMGRRLRRNYSFLFLIQAVSYMAKICIHPTAVRSLDQLWERASIGPVPGEIVLIIGFLFHAGLIAVALLTLRGQLAAGRVKQQARSQ
jgi:hypothetical protein